MAKSLPANAGDTGDAGSNSGSGRTPGERKWQRAPVSMPGKSHGQRKLQSMGLQRVGHN